MNNDGLSETIMVTLVGARPLMLPLQQTDICIATKIEIVMNGYNYLDNLLALFFLLEELVSKKQYYKNCMRISYHSWTESMILSFSRSTERSIN